MKKLLLSVLVAISLVGCAKESGKKMVTVTVGPVSYQAVFDGQTLEGVRYIEKGASRFFIGEEAAELELFYDVTYDSFMASLDERGISKNDVETKSVSGDVRQIFETMMMEEPQDQPKPEKPEVEEKDHNQGKWRLNIYDYGFYDYNFEFVDGVLVKYDFIFTKSGEMDEDAWEEHYEGDGIKDCEYYGMTSDQILEALDGDIQEFNLNVHWKNLD